MVSFFAVLTLTLAIVTQKPWQTQRILHDVAKLVYNGKCSRKLLPLSWSLVSFLLCSTEGSHLDIHVITGHSQSQHHFVWLSVSFSDRTNIPSPMLESLRTAEQSWTPLSSFPSSKN